MLWVNGLNLRTRPRVAPVAVGRPFRLNNRGINPHRDNV